MTRLDEKLEHQMEVMKHNIKNTPVFIWGKNGDLVTLKYYHAYKSDLCDTMFEGTLHQGLNGCQLVGKICKPRIIWVLFFVFAAASLILFAIFSIGFFSRVSYGISTAGDYSMLNHLPAFLLNIPFIYCGRFSYI